MKNYKLKLTILLTMTTLLLVSCNNDDTTEQTTTPVQTQEVEADTDADTELAYIGMPKAEEIALAHANINASDTLQLDTTMDLEDEHNIKYDVSFYVESVKYEYKIHARTGEILEYISPTATEDGDVNINTDDDLVPENSDYIGQLAAIDIAYSDAKISENDIEFIHAKLDVVDDVTVYSVEFYIGNVEYDYEIDALTGEILAFDNDAELFDVSVSDDIILGEAIGEEKAIAIARENAGVETTSNLFVKLETAEDSSAFYWVEFMSDDTQYGYKIHSVTGDILSIANEKDDKVDNGEVSSGTAVNQQEESPYIGEGKAVSTAVNHAGSDPNSEISVELIVENSKSMYHIGFSIDSTQYKYEIDAINGKIMSQSKETKNYNNEAGAISAGNDTSSNDVIGDDAALAIALKFVGADSATFIKMDFSIENGTAVYEIDFRIDNVEYEFEIDAISGKILDYSKE